MAGVAMSTRPRERWGTRIGLVLAMAGNAVGLGNFLRFPAQAARNGGGAFLIPYFVSLLVMGLPLIWVEWTMGRHGGQYRHHSAPGVFHTFGQGKIWKYLGVLGLWVCLVIASYYLYIESWCMAYAGFSAINGFAPMKTPEQVKGFFQALTGERENQILAISGWGMAIFALCITINIYILSRGLAKGIELVSKIGMPILILFAAILAVRGLMISKGTDPNAVEDATTGLNFVWNPDLSKVGNPATWIAAAGQIFFTLSIGMGTIHCYASYIRRDDDVVLTGSTAAWTNEFCEVVLGGSILLPVAVAYLGITAVTAYVAGGSGFGLGFMVFPTLFNNWGWFAPAAGFMWFGLLFFAAITSSLAMGQPIMSFLQEEFGFNRRESAMALGVMILGLAIPVAIFHESTFNAEFDFWGGSVALVVFALIETILFAWIFGIDRGWREMMHGAEMRVPRVFYYIIKYVTPAFLALILVAFVFMPRGRVAVEDASGKITYADKGWEPYVLYPLQGKPLPPWEWSGEGMIGKLLHKDLVPPPDASPEARQFNEQVKFIRNIDRIMMVGVFVGMAVAVNFAWRKRAREGRL
jgi:NSS family neurotransmitter:Na+ symporter